MSGDRRLHFITDIYIEQAAARFNFPTKRFQTFLQVWRLGDFPHRRRGGVVCVACVKQVLREEPGLRQYCCWALKRERSFPLNGDRRSALLAATKLLTRFLSWSLHSPCGVKAQLNRVGVFPGSRWRTSVVVPFLRFDLRAGRAFKQFSVVL